MKETRLTQQQRDRIDDILTREGFSNEQKDAILCNFTEFGNHYEFYKNNANYGNILLPINRNKNSKVSIYKSLINQKNSDHVKEFISVLKQKNLSLPDALALNLYSNNSIISQIKRMEMIDKNSYLKLIQKELRDNIDETEDIDEKLNAFFDFMQALDYEKKDYFKSVENYINKDSYLKDYYTDIDVYAIKYKFYCQSFQVIKKLDKTLKNQVPYNIVVYRGIKKSDFADLFSKNHDFFDIDNPSTLIGEKLSDDGYTSTSLRYDMCFARRSYKNLFLKILVPKGSQGFDISNFSSYSSEEEVLFNSNDLYLIDYDYVNDVNQHCFTALLLSKDRECYKNIGSTIMKEEENE